MREALEERDFNPNCSVCSVPLTPEGREQLLLPADTCSCVFVVSPSPSSPSSSSSPRQLWRRDDSATDVLSNKPDKWTVHLWHKVNSRTPRVHKTIQPLLFFSAGGVCVRDRSRPFASWGYSQVCLTFPGIILKHWQKDQGERQIVRLWNPDDSRICKFMQINLPAVCVFGKMILEKKKNETRRWTSTSAVF